MISSYPLMDIVTFWTGPGLQHKSLSLDHPPQSTLSCLAKPEVLKARTVYPTVCAVHTPIDLIVDHLNGQS